jgi:heme/copper-type cytochrome/quinol oxidase subunit 1
MATITADSRLATGLPEPRTEQEQIEDTSVDHGLARFFYAACAALIISAIQGVVQRMPGISDWLRDADYGGHMVTNLALTHITIVGAGTITLTGLIYYVLPRVTKTPLFSKALTNFSFWATLIGVFGFYLAMLIIGTYEGMMVHAGWGYDDARNYMGALHKAPMAATAAIMGLGYWTFVTNVYVTVGRGAGLRKTNPSEGASDRDFLLAKFFAVGATGLLFGTVQGVYQVLPWSLDWLRSTGAAGHMIDPMAHAHMNLVGGVSIALMGLLYFFLPKMLGRPIHSMKLAVVSFWFTFIGVFAFYFSANILGFIEGTMMLEQGLTDVEAKEAVGAWHPVLLAGSATLMGIGFWTFIANILLTVRRGPAEDAPPDRTLARFIAFASVAILVGTVQGVIQTLDPIRDWLEEATPAGYFITPLSHAQLNMVGFVMVSLLTMAAFLLPRILDRKVEDPRGARRALAVLATGIGSSYVVFFSIGLIESIAIHNGVPPGEARLSLGGPWGRYLLLIGAQALVGLGYILMFRHVHRVVGRDQVRAYFRTFAGRMRSAGREYLRVHERARPASMSDAYRRAWTGLLMETVGGAFGVIGLGWLMTGRPFIGIMVLGSWGVGFWTMAYVLIAVTNGSLLLPILLIPYFTAPVVSGIGCYRSYIRNARQHLASGAVGAA